MLRINPLTTSIDTRNLFENIDIPTFVWYHDKQGEWQALHEMGLSEVAKATWFCHNPIFGLPCGHCNPCKDVKEAGMEYRLSLKGKLLYNILKPYFWIIAHF